MKVIDCVKDNMDKAYIFGPLEIDLDNLTDFLESVDSIYFEEVLEE